MTRRVTLKDIARETGVHVSTVSRALDPKRETPLTDDVVKKIRETANRMGYRPNRAAYSLRTNKTMTIGVLIPDITNMIFPPIVRGVESVMEPAGYTSIIVNTDSQQSREQKLLETLRERGVDGIIHTAVLRDNPGILTVLQEGLPIVTLNRKIEGTNVPYVINDEDGGISAVFDMLVKNGHRCIAHLAGPYELSTGRLRLEAFRQATMALGLDITKTQISEAERFDEAEGFRCAKDIIENAPETTAILCANDRLAIGALDYLRSVGLECPKDVSITGFNDMPFVNMIPPGLTTVRIKQFEAGQVAAQTLLSLLEGRADEVSAGTVLPVQLVERASVGPVRLSA